MVKKTIDSIVAVPNQQFWTNSLCNEWIRLAQGRKWGVRHTNAICFHDVTYIPFVLDNIPTKKEQNRVRNNVDEVRLPYPDNLWSQTANLLETKVLINSTISDWGGGQKDNIAIVCNGNYLSHGNQQMRSKYYIELLLYWVWLHYNCTHICREIKQKNTKFLSIYTLKSWYGLAKIISQGQCISLHLTHGT